MLRQVVAPVVALSALLAVCVGLFWTGLGDPRSTDGLAFTEGHRAIPGWALLADVRDGGLDDPRDALVTRMFGQVYLRKPPGMPWAVAVSGAVFGESAWSARAPSALAATGMAVFGFWIAGRWFGGRDGGGFGWRAALAGGLATALIPRLWPSARAAEIEALNNLGTMVAALAVIALITPGASRRWAWLVWGAIGALGLLVMGLAKGPAGAPVVIAAVVGSMIARRAGETAGTKWIGRPTGWNVGAWALAIGVPGAVLGTLAWMLAGRLGEIDEPVVLQGPSDFLWGEPLATLALPAVAWVMAFPAALAVLFPFGPDARREAESDEQRHRLVRARAIAWAFVISVIGFAITGVSNPRYAMPAFALVGPLAGYVIEGWSRGGSMPFGAARRRIASVVLLGHPAVWAVVLAAGYVFGFRGVYEPDRRATSGSGVGVSIAGEIAQWSGGRSTDRPGVGGVLVWADDVIEARPEVLLAVVEGLEARGVAVDARWSSASLAGPLFEAASGGAGDVGDGVLLVRSAEREAALGGGWVDGGGRFEVHRYRVWWMVRPGEAGEAGEAGARASDDPDSP